MLQKSSQKSSPTDSLPRSPRRHAGAGALGHPGRWGHLQRLRLRGGDGGGHHHGQWRQLLEQGQGLGREGAYDAALTWG